MTDKIDKLKTPPGWPPPQPWMGGYATAITAEGRTEGECLDEAHRIARENANPFTAPLKARIAELEAELNELKTEVMSYLEEVMNYLNVEQSAERCEEYLRACASEKIILDGLPEHADVFDHHDAEKLSANEEVKDIVPKSLAPLTDAESTAIPAVSATEVERWLREGIKARNAEQDAEPSTVPIKARIAELEDSDRE